MTGLTRKDFLGLGALAAAGAAGGCAPDGRRSTAHGGRRGPGTSDLETLHDLNRNYVRAVQESDVRWFDQPLTQDFLNSNPDGSLVDRAAFLVQVGRPVTIANLQAEDG
jgi:hypothetical protein